jgi:undecaprenyl diphosphate synthase
LFGFKKNQHSELPDKLPEHIAIIMDGNGRWAKKRGLPRSAGHSAGAANYKTIARYCNKIGIKYLTVYAFSTENWKRSQEEVNNIMNLLREYLIDSKNFKSENIRLHFIGDMERVPDDIVRLIDSAEQDSAEATGLWCNIALNYGGRDEILHAVRRIAHESADGKINPDRLTEDDISSRLYTAGMPDPDLVIRPSGEYRLSNFLIWQTAYAEFWYTDKLWPDFKPSDIDQAIIAYARRDRRFGNAK